MHSNLVEKWAGLERRAREFIVEMKLRQRTYVTSACAPDPQWESQKFDPIAYRRG